MTPDRPTPGEPSGGGLRDRLLALIAAEGLRPGDRLPPEADLARRLGVSRSKAREALARLEQEGLLHAHQGLGRFVSPSALLDVERPVTVYESITEMLSGRGQRLTTAVLDVQEGTADGRIAGALAVDVGTPIIRLTRLRLVDDEPMVFSRNAVRQEALPGPIQFRDWSGSLTDALQAAGHRIVSSAARLTATLMPAEDAERYGLRQYDPWLLVQETCITAEGIRVMHALDYHRGSEIAFNVLRRR